MDKTELSRAIKDSGLKLKAVAAACGIDRNTLRGKLSGKSEWHFDELAAIRDMLHMDSGPFWAMVERDYGRPGHKKS